MQTVLGAISLANLWPGALPGCALCFRILLAVCAALIVYVYAGYPAILLLLGAFCRRRNPEPGFVPFLSVLIAAYNEQENIGRKIEQTLALDYPAEKLEVLVLSDCSTDRTDEIVTAFRDPRVRLVRIPERHGKTHAQNEGVKAARGEVLVFSDATTVYHPQALRYLACNYQDATVGAATGRNQYFDAGGDSPTGMGTVMFWNYENVIKTMQSRIRTLTGCVGCIYSVRKSAYTELADDVISDLVQPLWVIQKGYRVVFEDRALAYEETTQDTAEEFAMRVRVVTRAIRGLASVPELFKPWRYGWVSFQLISHKVMRWMIWCFLLGAFLGSALAGHGGWVGVVFWLQAAFYAIALVSLILPLHRIWKVLGVPLYFCTINAAAFVSILELCRGRKYVVWQTVRKVSA
jgi:cellulose synthase/poly-beta-1,6-N-acetylglucosamine synthase-like glycosyltransferase